MTKSKSNHPTLRKSSSCHDCAHRCGNEFSSLHSHSLQIIDKDIQRRQFAARRNIRITEHSGLVGIADGMLAVARRTADGKSVYTRFIHAGEIFGQEYLFTQLPRDLELFTLTPVSACFISRKAIMSILPHEISFNHRLTESIARNATHSDDRIQTLHCESVRSRMLRMLSELSNHYSIQRNQRSAIINLPLRRRDIASFLATRPETVARTIRELGEENIAHFDGKIVNIPNIEALNISY